ncbi:hypothetical protein [Lapillicoccus sp.]|uniref:hypothetical protein n=1 Tax=Lapillicoccus sp. TaxID=1909287 RepID=UPI003263B029
MSARALSSFGAWGSTTLHREDQVAGSARYERVTVTEICEAADIAPRTFFR